MKNLSCRLPILLYMAFPPFLFAQININHNQIRIGDNIIKQQVEYIGPGDTGYNIVWDFSKLKTIKEEYELTYSPPLVQGDTLYIMGDYQFPKENIEDSSLIIGNEHNTMYYYQLKKDTLFLLGHENPVIKLKYNQPLVSMLFPLNLGDKVISTYNSFGLYSATEEIYTKGISELEADAFGTLITPQGDTLNPVLRTKNIQIINEDGGIPTKMTTYKWYTKGYRYPIFETVQNINLDDNSPIFSTAFFYPPQEHLYLDTDPENLALIEENWGLKEKGKVEENQKTKTLEDIVSCKIHPNPVESILTIEYTLKEDADVSFYMYAIDGTFAKSISSGRKQEGYSYQEYVDCSSLYPKIYIIQIIANGLRANYSIIKQ